MVRVIYFSPSIWQPFFLSFFPLLQSNSNLGLLIKTFNSLLYFEFPLENKDKFEELYVQGETRM